MARPNPLVQTQLLDGVLLERYDYEPGPPADIERHVHESYQIGLALDEAGEYRYRGATEPVPTRQLVIIHPGEPHAVRDTGPRMVRCRYLMMYVEPSMLTERDGEPHPFFAESVADPGLVVAFAALFEPAAHADSEARIASLLSQLSVHSSDPPPRRDTNGSAAALARVRDALHDAPLADTSLADLARIADLNPHHLVRAFTARYGVPPHRYRRQLRIELAKRWLSRGEATSRVALATGFYDQSHFNRHFRRIVGTTPGRYRPVDD